MTADDATAGGAVRVGAEDPAADEPIEGDVDRADGELAEPAVPARTSRIRLLASPLRVLGVVVVLSVGLAAGLYVTEQRPDMQTDSAAARSAVKAASKGAAAVLSYAPASLDGDLAAAKSHLTGEFLAYYSKFSDEVLRPRAAEKHITSKATVVQAAVSELHPHSAKVLVFVNQLSSSNEKPMVAAGSSVIVSLTKSDGTWLISAFEPV
ncbi:MAG TPA: twin-arginine translocation pathway signal [Mycobacterium sp.]|nr:twin-arginine translocation pathway signal [Mycobacterium sp.]